MGYPSMMPMCGGLREPRGSGLKLLKSTFNGENSICRLSGLSQAILAQFILEMYVAARNRKKITKTPILGVKGHLRSLILMSIERAYGCVSD